MINELRENWQSWTLVALLVLAIGWGNFRFAKDAVDSQETFKRNICGLVAQSQKQDKTQIAYYSGLEDRAVVRAKVDTGTAKQADLDAASSARHTKNAYVKAEKFKFPGC